MMEYGYKYYSWLRENHPHDFQILLAFCKAHSDIEEQNEFMTDLQILGWLPAYEE